MKVAHAVLFRFPASWATFSPQKSAPNLTFSISDGCDESAGGDDGTCLFFGSLHVFGPVRAPFNDDEASG